MKFKYVFLGFLVGLLVSSIGFFTYQGGNFSIQSFTGTNFTDNLGKKIDEIKKGVLNLGTNDHENIGSFDFANKDKLAKFNDIKHILDSEYVDPKMISGSKMWDYAMQAYVAALGDPFTNYLTANDNKSLHEELKGSSDFQGIGAVVTKVPEGILIEQLIKDGPAQKAGLKPLDIVLEANGKNLSGLPLGKAVSLIKGPAGTFVNLTIKRDGKIIKIKVKREKLKLTSVNSKIIDYKGQKFGYISISVIGEQTYTQFKENLSELLGKNVKGIILDIRGNGGGYLDVGYQIGSVWAKKGDIIVQTKYRNPLYNRIFKAQSDGLLAGFPTVVLIDGYTASAGEIITAAIKENNEKTTKLVGTQTFGKGTIQTIKKFDDGSSLKYTIGKWFTPKNENVCKEGVLPGNGLKPDVEVKFDSEKYKKNLFDNQLEKAKEVLLKMVK